MLLPMRESFVAHLQGRVVVVRVVGHHLQCRVVVGGARPVRLAEGGVGDTALILSLALSSEKEQALGYERHLTAAS